MNSLRHEFSSESYPNLLNFLEHVKDNPGSRIKDNPEHQNETKTWSKVLPPNIEFLNRLEEFKLDSDSRLIDLTKGSVDLDLEISNEISNFSKTLSTNTDVNLDDYVVIITQNLKLHEFLSKEIFEDLKLRLNVKQIDELFMKLLDELETDLVYKLGYSVINNELLDGKFFCLFYCQLLFEKLKEEESKKINEIFLKFLETFPQTICVELSRKLNSIKDVCPRALQENLNNLDVTNKQTIIREFILNCSKLEESHFPIIESLITDQMDIGILKKLIDLLAVSSNEYCTNKHFGKLLLQVLQKVQEIVKYFEQDLRMIITNHKSPWRNKALKLFESKIIDQSQTFSQTLHF